MAQAVQELFPGTQVTIGPAIEDGFYYDFARQEPFSLDDLEKIESRMEDIVSRNLLIEREVWERDEAKRVFAEIGEKYKVEIIEDLKTNKLIFVNGVLSNFDFKYENLEKIEIERVICPV